MKILVCFFKILKKKRGYIFMYLGIFFSIAIAMSLQGGNSEKSYENQKISFCCDLHLRAVSSLTAPTVSKISSFTPRRDFFASLE